MPIVFYISGHGFGHASRDVEVINRLDPATGEPVVIRSSVSPELLHRTLATPFDLRPGLCDTGIVQSSSITHEDEATVEAAVDFYATFDDRVAAEIAALSDVDVDLIVGDIPPLAFAVANRLGVPSVALANFTWDWIYEWHAESLDHAPGLLDQIRRSYRHASHALRLPLSGGFEVFRHVTPIPFIARHSTRTRTDARRALGLDPSRPVALLSFGGYGLQRLEVEALDCLADWTVLLTDRITSAGSDPAGPVRLIPESAFSGTLRYEDLVAAADVVVTKPGYGIISECVAHGTAMLYTSRGRFREYDCMVEQMPSLLPCRFIAQEDLFAGRWRDALNALMAQQPPSRQAATDGATHAAAFIETTVDTSSVPASRFD